MKTHRNRMPLVLAAMLAGLVIAGGAWTAVSKSVRDSSSAQILRGRYLVQAGDCAACHTADNGKPFAGGRPVPTPFGTIYSTNITPDAQTGIGSWTDDDFWRAMHQGIRPDGQHLYPAFPYPWYTKLDHDDVFAIKAYLESLEPVRNEHRPPDLPWPLSWRASVGGWNMLFFKEGTFEPSAAKSQEWNRGAYLVDGLGHCGACHSPKNLLGAVKRDQAFRGGMGEGWFAVNLTANPEEGLGAWSVDEIVEYLKTGATARARAYGPMAEVVEHSTSHLADADLRAIATFLKDVPSSRGQDASKETPATDSGALTRGRQVYIDQCAACHMENGEGIAGVFPSLHDNQALRAHDTHSLARLVIEGAGSVKTHAKPEGFAMPGFGRKLNDKQIADLLTYLRASFGNKAGGVAESKVSEVRKAIREGKA